MERISAKDLIGCNAYFTNFDHRIIKGAKDKGGLYKRIERSLKILLLTKNNIVCAASHLTSNFTYELIKRNPILLTEQLLIPAFRADKTSISELFLAKDMKKGKKKEMIDFYCDKVSKTVLWELTSNSNWFRDTFVKGIETKNSVIRRNLISLSNKQIDTFANEIRSKDILDRSSIDEFAKDFPEETKIVIRNYRELIYHMSGARVVNCESTLPQENYIDYSLADLKNRAIVLSDLQVFWKLFIELLFETLHKPKIPVELLDILSFEDIHLLKEPIQNSNFIDCYNDLYNTAINAVNKKNPDDLLYDVQELLLLKNKLSEYFIEGLANELKFYFKKKTLSNTNELLKSSVSIGLGFIPFNNLISGAIGVVNEFKSAQFNLTQSFGNLKSMINYDNYIDSKKAQIENSISSFEIKEKSSLLDVIELIMNTISQKIAI